MARSSDLASSPRWRLCGGTRRAGVAKNSPRSNQYAGGQNCRRWAPLPKKETSIAGSVIRDARASRRAGRIVIGLSAPPKNTRMRLSLASLSPMDASSRTCSAAVGRGGSVRLPRGRVASGLERTPTAKRLFLWLLRTCVFSKVAGCRVYTLTRPLACRTDTADGQVLAKMADETRFKSRAAISMGVRAAPRHSMN